MNSKIIYLHRTQAGFAEGEHIRGIIIAFQRLGFDVDVVGPPGIDLWGAYSSSNNNAPPSWKKKVWSVISEKAPQIAFEAMEFAFNPYGLKQLNQLLRNNSYDFIYERYALNTFYSYISAPTMKHVLEVNDATVIERSRPLVLKGVSRKLEKKIFDSASLLVTITNHFKDRIVSEHEIDPEKVLVTPNAINPEKFILDPVKRINREDMGIHNQKVIGCVGAFVPWHGLEFLVESLQETVITHDIHLLFVGDGPVRTDVEKLADTLNIRDRISFTGFIDPGDVPYYIDLMDVCVIPGSNPHCSPVKLFEYMAMGKPVILPKYQPLMDTIQHDREGLFFDIDDRDDLIRCIEQIMEDDDKRKRIGAQAKETVYSKHTWETNARNILSKLESL